MCPARRPSASSGTRPDVVVDGIVGIGGRPGLRPEAVAALEACAGVPVVAVDVPSGVDVDTGETDGPHVEAAVTVTFGTHKVAHLVDPAASAAGAVTLVDIGLDLPTAAVEALQPPDVAALLPRPDSHAHKYTRGVVGVRAGSATYPGAGLLCVAGASTGLCGMVRYVGDAAVADRVRQAHPEVVGEGRVQAWAVGSGGGDAAGEALAAAIARRRPGGRRRRRAGPRLAARWASRPCSLRTPASSPRCMGADRPRSRPRPLHHAREAAAPTTPWCCSRAGARWSPRRRATSGSPRPGSRGWRRPARATS